MKVLITIDNLTYRLLFDEKRKTEFQTLGITESQSFFKKIEHSLLVQGVIV